MSDYRPWEKECHTLLDALAILCDTITELGKARKASDLMASDIFDGDIENEPDWTDWLEPMLYEAYKKAKEQLQAEAVSA